MNPAFSNETIPAKIRRGPPRIRCLRLFETAVFLLPFLVQTAFSSLIQDRFHELAATLGSSYRTQRPESPPLKLEFNNLMEEESLRIKRVGYAVLLMLAPRLAEGSNFIVGDQARIKKSLLRKKPESGPSEAPLALRGNVSRNGAFYLVETQVVDTQTGQVLSAGSTELPVYAFEQEAKAHLRRIFTTPTFGVYAAAEYNAPVNNRESTQRYFYGLQGQTFNGSFEPNSFSANTLAAGVGLRYFPAQWLLLDAAYYPRGAFYVQRDVARITAQGMGFNSTIQLGDDSVQQAGTFGAGALREEALPIEIKSTAFSFSTGWVKNLSRRFRALAGAGATVHMIETKIPSFHVTSGVWVPSGVPPLTFSRITIDGTAVDRTDLLAVPFLRMGAEYRPHPRVGIGLFGKFNVANRELAISQRIRGQAWLDPSGGNPEIVHFDGPIYTIEAPVAAAECAIAFYF